MQYKTGTIQVTNGSQIVVGTGTAWTSNVAAGDIFTVVGDNVWYSVASVTDDTHLTLNANYAGTSASGKTYAITKDFTPNYNIPLPQQGDIETASLVARALQTLDTALKSVADRVTALGG